MKNATSTDGNAGFKIEKKALLPRSYHLGNFREFVLTLKALKVGESFVLEPPKSESNYRMAISIVQILMEVRMATAREGKNLRIARVG
jgi:hypothetical protein